MGYEYTKPRGPIAAMYSSPGPVYNLPALTGGRQHDPRSVHLKNPSWIFGVRHGKLNDDCSPGPATLLPDSQVTRFGKDGSAVYSLYSRVRVPSSFQAPGPGAYFPENAGPSAAPASPRYSFGARTRYRGTDANPAPNRYTLPGLLGRTALSGYRQAPIWSQTGRNTTDVLEKEMRKIPGPGSHNVSDVCAYRYRAPSYTLKPRICMVGDSTMKPGPGSHCPERVVINRRSAPSFSFGIRHSDYTAPLIIETQD